MKYNNNKIKSPLINDRTKGNSPFVGFSTIEDMFDSVTDTTPASSNSSNPTNNSSSSASSDYSWITNLGTSLSSIADVIFNGNSPKAYTSTASLDTESSNSSVWWIVGGVAIVAVIIFLSVMLKKKTA